MTCEVTFLAVGNADSIVICAEDNNTVIVDIGNVSRLKRWLQQNHCKHIDRIYITHAHKDHCPQLEDLVLFLEDWIERGVRELFLPYLLYKCAVEKLSKNKEKSEVGISEKQDRLKDAVERLYEWERRRKISFLAGSRGAKIYQEGDLTINILHPGSLFVEKHLAESRAKGNEISLVLRLDYGNFSAMLLGDLEGAGLRECCEVLEPNELDANVVKIPHHGAYPKNGEDLRTLLERIDAEIAVLSVGSTNNYGHVVPELFSLLCDLKNSDDRRLEQFICTEVTRTCVKSASERVVMQKKGLTERRLCAGNITIAAEASGKWEFRQPSPESHEATIAEFKYSACRGKADLG